MFLRGAEKPKNQLTTQETHIDTERTTPQIRNTTQIYLKLSGPLSWEVSLPTTPLQQQQKKAN